MKRKRGNTPRRKRLNREGRLRKAKEWIHTYNGKGIIKAYAKWFGVDWLCALDELKLAGVSIPKEDEQKIVLAHNQRIQQRRREKELRKAKSEVTTLIENEGKEFGFDIVIGYSSDGFPYGIKFEEEVEQFQWVPYDEQFEEDEEVIVEKDKKDKKEEMDDTDYDLPF